MISAAWIFPRSKNRSFTSFRMTGLFSLATLLIHEFCHSERSEESALSSHPRLRSSQVGLTLSMSSIFLALVHPYDLFLARDGVSNVLCVLAVDQSCDLVLLRKSRSPSFFVLMVTPYQVIGDTSVQCPCPIRQNIDPVRHLRLAH